MGVRVPDGASTTGTSHESTPSRKCFISFAANFTTGGDFFAATISTPPGVRVAANTHPAHAIGNTAGKKRMLNDFIFIL
jgi:hypothetical protein